MHNRKEKIWQISSLLSLLPLEVTINQHEYVLVQGNDVIPNTQFPV